MSRPRLVGRVAVLLCVAAAILAGCEKKDVAVVGATRISHDELVGQLEADYGHEVLSRMIDRQIIQQAFQQAGLQFPQEKLEKVIQEWRDQAGSEEEFQRQLAMQGRTEQDLRDAVEIGMKLEMLGQKDLAYTEEDLKKYYEENQLRYDEPERASFSEIVVASKDEADKIHAMASKPDAKFPDLAKQYSQGPTAAAGGSRPLMSREETIPVEARDVAFAMQPGQVSKPFEAAQQWMIIKLEDRKPAKKLSFEEARERVEEDYKREHMVQPPDLMQQLRTNAQVRVISDQYADLQKMYMGAALLPGAMGPAPTGAPPAGTPPPAPEGGQAPPQPAGAGEVGGAAPE